ncbi:KH domain-containing protein [Thermodesulfobacteriota bacterium]
MTDIELKDLIANIAKALVDNPEEVITTEIKGQHSSMIELKVAKEDIGKVIGKKGRTAQALRSILMSASAKLKKRCSLEILD